MGTVKTGKVTVTIVGAAGKIGHRIVQNLSKKEENYNLLFCEKGEVGIANLQKMSFKNSDSKKVIPRSDFIIIAVPDEKIREVSDFLAPLMKKDTTMIILDAAAPYLGEVNIVGDCNYIVTHPCHPPLFGEQDNIEAYKDHWGGMAKQDIVIALFHGKEDSLQLAEQVCKDMFAPVVKSHRVTVEQLALLEPAMAEVIVATGTRVFKEALDEVIRLGVPEEAARSFMLGHISAPLFNFFGPMKDGTFSDGCLIAMDIGQEYLIKPKWKDIFKPEVLMKIVKKMIRPEKNI